MKYLLFLLILVSTTFAQSMIPEYPINSENLVEVQSQYDVHYKYLGKIASPKANVNRKVYYECGTNTSCGYCATYNPYFKEYMSDNADSTVALTYHAWWPGSGDPFYSSNITDNRALINHNDVNGVPQYNIDGIFNIYPITYNLLEYYGGLRKAVSTPVDITVVDQMVDDDSIKATVTLDVYEKLIDGSFKLRIFAVDRIREYDRAPGGNGERKFEYVFRKAFPNVAGTTFDGSEGSHEYTVTYPIEDDWRGGVIYTIAYLQNDNNKEVLNADYSNFFNSIQPTTQVLPENGSVTENFDFELEWSKSYNTLYYELQVANDESFTDLVINESTLTELSYNHSLVGEGVKQYWRVRAAGEVAVSDYSDVWSFVSPLYTPEGMQLTNNGTSISLNWQDNSQIESNYIVERAITKGIGIRFVPIDTLDANTTSYIDNYLEEEGMYKYRVMAFNEDSYSLYSDTASTDVTSIKELPGEVANFELAQNYPNPFNPTTKIRYSLPAGVENNYKVVLTVYDALGKRVRELVNTNQQSGNYEVTFNGTGLSSGVYYYTIKANDITSTKKFILMK